MFITRDGGFTFEIGPKDLSKGLRPRKTLPRNDKFLVECIGAVGYEEALQTIEDVSSLLVDTSVIYDGYPYPQIFCFTNHTIVCGRSRIYELVDGVLELKFIAVRGIRWTAVDFYNFIYLTNDKVSVILSADGTYSLSNLPIGTSLCNFNGQVLIGAPSEHGVGWNDFSHHGEAPDESESDSSPSYDYSPDGEPIPGDIWGAGLNYYGQLGLGFTGGLSTWTKGVDYWIYLGGGNSFTLAIKEDRTLWVVGRGQYGVLGLGDESNKNVLTQVGTDKDWALVSKGEYDSFAIKEDGTLWATGYNAYGELGLGDQIKRTTWTQVGTDKWKQAHVGVQLSCAIRDDGRLCATDMMGHFRSTDKYSLLPIDDPAHRWKKVSVGSYHVIVLMNDGSLWGYGQNNDHVLGIPTTGWVTLTKLSDSQWLDIAAGWKVSLAIRSDGTLWGTGDGVFGQLGLGDKSSRSTWTLISSDKWKQVDVGMETSLAIKDDDTLWVWGYNSYGQLGLGDSTERLYPTKVESFKCTTAKMIVNHSEAIEKAY